MFQRYVMEQHSYLHPLTKMSVSDNRILRSMCKTRILVLLSENVQRKSCMKLLPMKIRKFAGRLKQDLQLG